MPAEILKSERLIIAVGGLIGTGLLTVFWFAIRKFFVTRADHDAIRTADVALMQKLADTVDKLTDRVVALETRVNALPTESMLHNLNLSISELAGAQQGQKAQLTAMNNTLMLIQQHLLETR